MYLLAVPRAVQRDLQEGGNRAVKKAIEPLREALRCAAQRDLQGCEGGYKEPLRTQLQRCEGGCSVSAGSGQGVGWGGLSTALYG